MEINRLMMNSDTRVRLLDYASSIPALVAEEKRVLLALKAKKVAAIQETPPAVEVVPASLPTQAEPLADDSMPMSVDPDLTAEKEAFLTSVLDP